jgi:arsenite methyltransferase
MTEGANAMRTISPLQQSADAPPAWSATTYERLARNPYATQHFHRGPYYARHYLGYPEADLEQVPKIARDRFAGVGNPFAAGAIHRGETVLDLGCGAGTDLIIAAHRAGPSGRVIGIDDAPTMRRCAQMAAKAAGVADRVEIRAGRFEALPVANAEIDVVIANGIIAPVPYKARVFAEIHRVLNPGGRLYLADLVIDRQPALNPAEAAALWRACSSGIPLPEELSALAVKAGLGECELLGCYDCVRNAPAADWVEQGVRIHGAILRATKGEVAP